MTILSRIGVLCCGCVEEAFCVMQVDMTWSSCSSWIFSESTLGCVKLFISTVGSLYWECPTVTPEGSSSTWRKSTLPHNTNVYTSSGYTLPSEKRTSLYWYYNSLATQRPQTTNTWNIQQILLSHLFSPQSESRSAVGWGKEAFLSGLTLSSLPSYTRHHHPESPRPSLEF